MSGLRDEVRVMLSASAADIRYKFTAVPAWLWATQLLAMSLFQMAFFALVTDHVGNEEVDVAYVALGNALQSVAFTTVFAVGGIAGGEKHSGTLSVIMGTPTRLYTIFVGKSLFQILAGMFTAVVSLSYATFIFGVDMSSVDLAAMAATVVITCFAMTGFGLMISSVGMYLRSSMVLASLLMYLSLILSGVNFPISYLPAYLRPLSEALPMTHGIRAIREAAAGADILAVGPELAIMAAIGVIMVTMGYVLFDRFEAMAKDRGTLDLF